MTERTEDTIITDEPRYAAAPPTRGDVVQETNLVNPRDRVRWGPIVAGLLTALGIFILASVLLVALGLQGVRVGDPNADDAAATGGIITAVIGLLAFFIGGLIAGRSAAVGGRVWGALNGFLVWALGLLLLILFAGLGVGGILGAAGDLFQQYRAAGSPRPDVDPGQVLQGIKDAAFPAFLGLALPALASTLGGFLGARDEPDPRSRRWIPD